MTTYLYPWNPFQDDVAARVTDELATVSGGVRQLIVPRAAPFFSDKVTLVNSETGIALDLGKDYVFAYPFLDFIKTKSKNVYGAIILLKAESALTVKVSYDTIGGPFVLDDVSYAETVANLNGSNRLATWEQVVNLPAEGFPADPHDHPISQTYNYNDFIANLQGLVEALNNETNNPTVKTLLTEHSAAPVRQAHPNGEPADVGLGEVKNYPPAAVTDFSGNSDELYMTLGVTKTLIDQLISKFLKGSMPTDFEEYVQSIYDNINASLAKVQEIAASVDSKVADTIKGRFTFFAGGTLESTKDYIYDADSKSWYYWIGEYPEGGKVVGPGTTPYDNLGILLSDWACVGSVGFAKTLKAETGSKELGYRSLTVYDALNRIRSLSDTGTALSYLGYNSAADAAIWASKATDNDLLIPGGIHLSKNLTGIRRNAVVESMLGNNDGSFIPQIVAVSDSIGLAKYGMAEDVLSYRGIVGKTAIITAAPTFTATSITITDAADISKVKVGSIIKTSDSYFGLVSAINGKVFTVDKWSADGSTAGTPAGATANLNHVDKTYLANWVSWIPETYTGSKVVGIEWDFMNAKLASGERNGLDFVLHSSSKYNMDTAFLVRSAIAGLGWETGVAVQGANYASFLSAMGTSGLNPTYDLFLDSGSKYGIGFNGRAASTTSYSMLWRYSSSSTVYPSALNVYGFRVKGGEVTGSATSGTAITINSHLWYINNRTEGFSLVLPGTNLVAGQSFKFFCYGASAFSITCSTSSIQVNDVATYTHTPRKAYESLEAFFDGTKWFVG